MSERLEIQTTEYVGDNERGAESEAIKQEFIKYVEKLMEQNEHFLGKGYISEVHGLDVNENVCVKVTNDSKEGGTISSQLKETPFYNSVEIEANFMSELQDIRGEVGVPRPYYSVEHILDAHGGGNISALAMEKLEAVSVEDIVYGRADIPEAYDHYTFWEKLEKFVEKMHEKNIYHRDIHKGNVMIGKKDGKPYLIDFGAAVHATAYDEPYAEHRPGRQGLTNFTDDFSGINTVRRELIKELTNRR